MAEKSEGVVDLGEGGDDDRGVEDDHQVRGQDDGQDDRRVGDPTGGSGGPVRSGDAFGQGGGIGQISVRLRWGGVLKWRHPPELCGGALRIVYGGALRFATRRGISSMTSTDDHHRVSPPPAEAGRCAAQLRQAHRRGPRGVHRGGGLGLAGGDRPPGRGRHRHPLPELPHPPGPARGRLRRRGRGGVPDRRGAARGAAVGGPGRLAAPVPGLRRHQAGPVPGAVQPPRPGLRRLRGLPDGVLRGRREAAGAGPGSRRGPHRRRDRRRGDAGGRHLEGAVGRGPGRSPVSSTSRSRDCVRGRPGTTPTERHQADAGGRVPRRTTVRSADR